MGADIEAHLDGLISVEIETPLAGQNMNDLVYYHRTVVTTSISKSHSCV